MFVFKCIEILALFTEGLPVFTIMPAFNYHPQKLFLPFFIGHLLLAGIVAFAYQQYIQCPPFMLCWHVAFVVSMYGCIIITGSLLACFSSVNSIALQHAMAFCWASVTILLYFVYILAFIGQEYNSRPFTMLLFWSYLKNMDALISNTSYSAVWVYAALFGVPCLIMVATLRWCAELFATPFYYATKYIKIWRHSSNRLQLTTLISCFACILVAMVIAEGYGEKCILRMQYLEEPASRVLLTDRTIYQNQTLQQGEEDISIRKNYPDTNQFKKKNVVIIIVDALRADHLSMYGYGRKTSPFLDSMYNNGHLQKANICFSAAGASFAGILGIERSKIWSHIGHSNFSIQDLLRDKGYEINFLISGDHTNYYDLKSFYGNDTLFNVYLDGSGARRYTRNDDSIIFEGLGLVKNYQNNPSFFQIHLNSAHFTGKKYAAFQQFTPCRHNKNRVEYTNNYDNGILQADYFIRNIFNTLQQKGYLQNSIVIVTADHGEALGERGIYGHTKNVYTDHILTPLLIYDSDSVQYHQLKYATALDIAPTIVDRLGLPIPASWEGCSLLNGTVKKYSYHQMGDYYAVMLRSDSALIKYIYNGKTHTEELYSLTNDLYEKHNLISATSPALIDSFRQQLNLFNIQWLSK
ncbi:sulfatase-like hydrolase/transferase [Limnovirga soli]|uniref:Sulfatase-like hydrolase/transferase n=1 Tax=Limnovirga soli TaxID=2656915 RepID=A0A8J8FKG2_9BACT|nr:sulfatase-like hydrolase/transferase [Limnovirga soli]NNV56679.1 sulfatase-like hydrolase/transferase [Limnovirga soli]